jgi:predicted ATPase/DNA-binding CsgD family transcriptional regulator
LREQRRSTIPFLPGPLVGREQELAFARQLFLEHDVRLLTLTGPPGVGKTSLSLALATELEDHFPDGARLVDLSTTSDAALVAAVVADSLGAAGSGGPLERLVSHLVERQLLLLIDNFEQVIMAAPLIAELLRRCRNLTMLITSRAPLRLRWEQELPVEPLALPDPADTQTPHVLARAPSIRLFVERARAVSPGFSLTEANATAVAGLCRRLDGLPLAIELAAARVRLLSPAAMLRQLTAPEADTPGTNTQRADTGQASSLQVLASGARDLPPRQQALRGAIDWSYALLDDAERALFRRLGIFAGGCTVEAVEAVAVDDGPASGFPEKETSDSARDTLDLLGSLVEKSLLRRDELDKDEPRLRMLQTIQEYAVEQLGVSGEADAVRVRHTAFYAGLAERAGPELIGPDQAAWLDRLDGERGNLRAAGRRAAAHGDAETVLRLGAALWRYWWARSDAAETRERMAGILALAALMPASSAHARALHGAGVLARELGEYPRARALLGESLVMARALDDRELVSGVLESLGWLAQLQGSYAEARALLGESLEIARQLSDQRGAADILAKLAYVAFAEGDRAGARSLNDRSLEAAHQVGDRRVVGDVLFNLGLSAHVERSLAEAREYYEESRAVLRELGHRPALAQTLHLLGHVATMQGDVVSARGLFREALLTARQAGNRRRLAFVLWAIASLVATEGEADLAVRLDSTAHAAAGLMGAALARPVRQLYDELLAPAQDALGPTRVVSARAAGRAMALDDAVDEALNWLADGTDRAPGGTTPAPSGLPLLAVDPSSPEPDWPGHPPVRPMSEASSKLNLLTPREREIATLIGQGLTSREIAERLVIGKGTADTHADHIRTKLDLRSRAEIAAWAVHHGLLDLAHATD